MFDVLLSMIMMMMICLTERGKKICTPDYLQAELAFIRETFSANGYPRRFVSRVMEAVKLKDKSPTVEKKRVYINLPFKGDSMAELVSRKVDHENLFCCWSPSFIPFFATYSLTTERKAAYTHDQFPCVFI